MQISYTIVIVPTNQFLALKSVSKYYFKGFVYIKVNVSRSNIPYPFVSDLLLFLRILYT